MDALNQLSVFSCGNGDTILLEAYGKTILTDINYRQSVQDDDDEEALDFAPQLQKACAKNKLDLFVLTHPDKDHLNGFGELLHLGKPESRSGNDEEQKILVKEIWCSPYAAEATAKSDEAKPVIKEIKRRLGLKGAEANADGNRIRVLSASPETQDTFTEGIAYRVLAPSEEEADVQGKNDPEDKTSSNSSSLVIQWTITVESREHRVLLCGDSTVDVFERLNEEVLENNSSWLAWDILVAPHHCSRHCLGRIKEEKEGSYLEDDPDFEISKEAVDALSEVGESSYVVASCKRFKKNDTPPHPQARKIYRKILGGGKVTEEAKERFLCTGGNNDDDDPQHHVLEFTRKGPSRRYSGKGSTSAILGGSYVGSGGEYGGC